MDVFHVLNCTNGTKSGNAPQIFKKVPFGQNKRYKKLPLFFRELQLITVLLLICDFLWAEAQGLSL